jgi:hypothetical protein
MTRYKFQTDKTYAAKLTKVSARPIENDPAIALTLIRLEFAIYWMAGEQRLESQGEIACRDIIVGDLIAADRDAGLVAYAQALRVRSPINKPANWTGLQPSSRWIEITFGHREVEGGRNPFATIGPFDAGRWTVKEYRYDRSAKWVTIKAAADAVGASESTVRRRIDSLETQFGSELVYRTDGGHRRIYLPLFMNVWED